MNDQVEWNRVTVDDTVVAEKGVLASNRGFCQTKQKSTSKFGYPLNESLQNSSISQIYDDVCSKRKMYQNFFQTFH